MKVMRILSVEPGPTEYMLSMIGFAVGLGNIWRFPYLTYKQGGGAFLIPYFLILVLRGIPLFFLENAIGQFCSQGPVNSWRAVPILQGVGLSVVLVTMFMSIYYNVIIAYSLYYMFASFQFPLPWSSCLSLPDSNCSTTPKDQSQFPCRAQMSLFLGRVALQRSSGMDETVLQCSSEASSHLAKWFILQLRFPVLILLIRGATLEGARDGIEFYIGSQSNLTKLTEAQVATSVFAGFDIFSILGHMAHIYGKPVAAVVKEEVLTTCLSDAFRENFKSKRTSLTIGTCVTVFLLGLPCVTRVILVWSFIAYVPPSYGNVQFPDWGLDLGWCMNAFMLLWVPAVAVGNPCKRLKSLCAPSEEWHPYLDIHLENATQKIINNKQM
ncbi:hypothetical protein JOQ06_015083 [Pogonophryne albipinna]|uniref:Transporter n=1 Tax=Pogonophryne albipinna TaxID=1090488 RepID=A0AAD6AKW8_9TELE|nr:hypothetical protein JOQ06_014677 [Pogonophryne albipinna]KAJ4927350.1 hypothetical protein JOQ06_015083 [Pogonophryne albipinna]